MTANRRIVLNIVATYGRSLLAMACGIFTSRWVLMALGETDFGLYGVVGAMAAFIAFINGALASSIARYYAYSVGAASVANDRNSALEECRIWFSVAAFIHFVVPLFLMIVGYPIGVWAIHNYLTIPTDRVGDCIWVFRFVCLSCFICMVNVPFTAMYNAKQYIAELTLYSVATSVINFLFSWWMVEHENVWLVPYACVMCLSGAIPQLMIMIRGYFIHPECRFSFRYALSFDRMKQLLKFAGWNTVSAFGFMIRNEGIAIVVNKFYGPRVNASMSIANSVNGHASTLSGALIAAFLPAITNACGARQFERMRALTYRASKFGVLLALLFLIPLALELNEVMILWLKNPPVYSTGLCLCMMLVLLVDKATVGHCVAVTATGDISRYQMFFGACLLLTLPLAIAFAFCGLGVYSVAIAIVIAMAMACAARVWFARVQVALSIGYWLFRIIVPIVIVSSITLVAGYTLHFFMQESFIRVCATTILSEIVFLPLVWYCVLDVEEKDVVLKKILKRKSV